MSFEVDDIYRDPMAFGLSLHQHVSQQSFLVLQLTYHVPPFVLYQLKEEEMILSWESKQLKQEQGLFQYSF